ncbi:Protein of unknown function [Pyronema omphalodes CBS 100304]|uniref:Uncharacterized protein n=1 Tax=Pyronema omphalodes (strain CBS 100304) TaxID=1076935 RepID=U4LFX1_PYROM|nr:Protein of unknown function [Pyronema omphalodes CBS 100304]
MSNMSDISTSSQLPDDCTLCHFITHHVAPDITVVTTILRRCHKHQERFDPPSPYVPYCRDSPEMLGADTIDPISLTIPTTPSRRRTRIKDSDLRTPPPQRQTPRTELTPRRESTEDLLIFDTPAQGRFTKSFQRLQIDELGDIEDYASITHSEASTGVNTPAYTHLRDQSPDKYSSTTPHRLDRMSSADSFNLTPNLKTGYRDDPSEPSWWETPEPRKGFQSRFEQRDTTRLSTPSPVEDDAESGYDGDLEVGSNQRR